MMAQQPENVAKALCRQRFLGILVLPGGQIAGPRDDQAQIAGGAHLVRRNKQAGVIQRLGRDHPVAAHRVLDVDILIQNHRVEPPPGQAQQRAQLDLDPGADIGLLGLFELVIRAPPGLGSHDHIVDATAQHHGEGVGERLGPSRAPGDLGRDRVEAREIRMAGEHLAGGESPFHLRILTLRR